MPEGERFVKDHIRGIMEKYGIQCAEPTPNRVAPSIMHQDRRLKVGDIWCYAPEIVWPYRHEPDAFFIREPDPSRWRQKLELKLVHERDRTTPFLSDDQKTLNVAVDMGEKLAGLVRGVSWFWGFGTTAVIKFDDFEINSGVRFTTTHPIDGVTHHVSGGSLAIHIRLAHPDTDIPYMTSLTGCFCTEEAEWYEKTKPILKNIRPKPPGIDGPGR